MVETQFENIAFIINPASGQNEPILNTINNALKESSDVKWWVSVTRPDRNAEILAYEAIDQGADLVAVYGGDGTLREAASALVNSDLPFCVLPGGTANALAADLSIPSNLADALQLIVNPDKRLQKIDACRLGDHIFLLRAGTGVTGLLGAGASRELKDRFGLLAYIISGLEALSNPQPARYVLTIDGETVEHEALACLVTNNNALGAMGLSISKHIEIDDGKLDVFLIEQHLRSLLGGLASVAQIDQLEQSLRHWQCKEIHIETAPEEGVYLDGETEPFEQTPVTIQVIPGALTMLVPE